MEIPFTPIKNNATAIINGAVAHTDGSLHVTTTQQAGLFPAAVDGQFWYTIHLSEANSTVFEIGKATFVTGTQFTLNSRGLDGSSAHDWPDGAVFAMYIPRGKALEWEGAIQSVQDALDLAQSDLTSDIADGDSNLQDQIDGINDLDKIRLDQQANTTLPDNTVEYIAYGASSETYKTNALTHNTVTNNTRITIQKDGIYSCKAAVSFTVAAAASGFYEVAIVKNRTTLVAIDQIKFIPSSVCSPYVNVTGDAELVAGDYLEVHAYQNTGISGLATAAPGGTFFSVAQMPTS